MGTIEQVIMVTDRRQTEISVAGGELRTERRRPGRPTTVSPELVALLRNPTTVPLPPLPPVYWDETDQTMGMPITGVAVAVILSGAIWAGLSVLGLAFMG